MRAALLIIILSTLIGSSLIAQDDKADAKLKPYYQRKGTIVLHFSNHMFRNKGGVTMPVSLQIETTVLPNLTLGPIFTYFQFKQTAFEGASATRFIGSGIRYNQYMVGLKSHYHLSDLVEKIINKRIPKRIIDIYLAGWLGYSFVSVSDSKAEAAIVSENEKVRSGIALGARSMVFKWLGLSLEGGYSSYGYASFGLTFVLR